MDANVSPGRSTAEGNASWFGASGNCCVSKQIASVCRYSRPPCPRSELPYVIDPRRPGDIAECWCDPAKAKQELGWQAEYGIEDMCRDSWNWQSRNPDGYKTAQAQ